MSYAEVAASGPSQTAEEARAPPVAELERSDDSTASLIDVDSPHISSVPSDFESQSVKTDTQAERLEREEEDRKIAAEKKASEAKEKAKEAKGKAKEKAKTGADRANKNKDNPVILGNIAAVGILGTLLGVGAYKKYTAGELSWKVVGAWTGVVGLFAAADYYVSSYFFQKYPPKK